MDVLSFDIETIPQPEALSDIQKNELDKRIDKYLDKNPKETHEDAKSLIMGTSPYFGKIICIGLYRINTKEGIEKEIAITGKEENILIRFWNMIEKFDGLFVSYNGVKFDVPFIMKRSMKYNILPTNINFLQTNPYKKYPHFDVQNILADFNRFDAVSLRLACDLMDVPSPKEGEIKAEDVAEAYRDGRIQEIADYCVRDVKATFEVYKRLKNYI